MDEEILNKIITELPQLTTREMFGEYNDKAPIQIKSYNQFISMLTEYPDLYEKLMLSKDSRHRKLQIALQDAESALIENASQGDIRSIEFLLKTQKGSKKRSERILCSFFLLAFHENKKSRQITGTFL